MSAIIAFLVLQLFSVVRHLKKEEIKTSLVQDVRFPRGSGIYVFKLDGHEYIYVADMNRSGICHKADCSLCKEGQK